VVVSIDAKPTSRGGYEAYTQSGTVPTGRDPVELAVASEKYGAGEILITSIPNDGTMNGYDIELIKRVSREVSVPVIASGGAGNFDHMARAIKEGNASAVAAASIFHFTHLTPLEAKLHLRSQGIKVRI
jgi:cyclase